MILFHLILHILQQFFEVLCKQIDVTSSEISIVCTWGIYLCVYVLTYLH